VPEAREKPEKIEVRLNISREGFALNFVSMYFTILGFFYNSNAFIWGIELVELPPKFAHTQG